MDENKIPKTVKDSLPETAEGLREYIKLAERELVKLHNRITSARAMLMVKENQK